MEDSERRLIVASLLITTGAVFLTAGVKWWWDIANTSPPPSWSHYILAWVFTAIGVGCLCATILVARWPRTLARLLWLRIPRAARVWLTVRLLSDAARVLGDEIRDDPIPVDFGKVAVRLALVMNLNDLKRAVRRLEYLGLLHLGSIQPPDPRAYLYHILPDFNEVFPGKADRSERKSWEARLKSPPPSEHESHWVERQELVVAVDRRKKSAQHGYNSADDDAWYGYIRRRLPEDLRSGWDDLYHDPLHRTDMWFKWLEQVCTMLTMGKRAHHD